MEPKYLAEEVIVHSNHPLTFGDWIPRDYDLKNSVYKALPMSDFSRKDVCKSSNFS